jgi:acetoin utilization deacetylase AcuC-like enzyme
MRGPDREESFMTLLYTDPLFLEHDTGAHPECAERLRAISARLEAAGLPARSAPGNYLPLAASDLRAVHTPAVAEVVRAAANAGGGRIEADTVVSPRSYEVALAAAGACRAAVDAVLTGADRTALCLVRPPGHHATPRRSMGFCLFNNIALAARRAVAAHGLNRVLIVDWDVHHGNGTQDVFYEDPQVTFFSIHRFGWGFYPGTGDADETGAGPGAGHTINAPVPYGISRKHYHSVFVRCLEEAADRAKPELVLLSAGFDAHARDPIGSLGLETEDYSDLTRRVLEVARTHAGGRLVSCLEGGYHLGALAESVQVHLEELLAAGT